MPSRVGVFCGSQSGGDARYIDAAILTASAIVKRGMGVIYGGGRVGLMGVLADTALAAGGEVIGVIPQALSGREIAHDGLTELHIVDSMHERKALMADLSDAFIALPGGFGTMDEFCEILTWRLLQIHDKPVGLLNAYGYYDDLIALFDNMVREGFVTVRHRMLFSSAESPDELLDVLLASGQCK